MGFRYLLIISPVLCKIKQQGKFASCWLSPIIRVIIKTVVSFVQSDNVCEDPAAVIGPGNGSSSPSPSSEPVAENNVGMIVGAVVFGLAILCYCFLCLVCVCCIYKKRKNRTKMFSQGALLKGISAAAASLLLLRVAMQPLQLHVHFSVMFIILIELSSFEDSSQTPQDNPLFIPPELIASSSSYDGSLKHSNKHKQQKVSRDNPYDELGKSSGWSKQVTNPLYSMKSLGRGGSPRPTSPSKNGYVSLNDIGDDNDDVKGKRSHDETDNFKKSGRYDQLEEAKSLESPYTSYSATDNPYVTAPPSKSEPLPPPLPPPRSDTDDQKPTKNPFGFDSTVAVTNPYETLQHGNPYEPLSNDMKTAYSDLDQSNTTGSSHPYETIPSYNDDGIYQEIQN